MNNIRNLLARAVIKLINPNTKNQTMQAGLLAGEIKGDMEHMEPYGFTSHPHPGAEGIASFFGGDRSHGVLVVVGDKRYRLKGLAEGEVALYDDLGQCVVLRRDKIEIVAKNDLVGTVGGNLSLTVTGQSTLKSNGIKFDSPTVEITGDLTIGGSGTASGDMTASGISLKSHVHGNVESGPSDTGAPK